LCHRTEPSGRAVRGWMEWTLEDKMVNSSFFRATLTGRRGAAPICASRSGNVRHWCRGG